MRAFEYYDPKTLEEACALLSREGEGAKLIAGGQSLLILLKQRLFAPNCLINLKGLPDLDTIRLNGGSSLVIGALATHRVLETSELIRGRLPALAELERRVGSVQIRNWGTLGGSLAHAEPAADPAPLLMALGGKVKAMSSRGARIISLDELFVGYYETCLAPDEILTGVEVPLPLPGTGAFYHKFTLRAGDMATVGVAAVLTRDGKGETCQEARIVLSAVASTPLRVESAEQALKGKRPDDRAIEAAARAASEEAQPVADAYFSEEYKREVARVFTRDAIREAWERAKA